MVVTDSANDGYGYFSNWGAAYGMGEAYAQSIGTGTVTISAAVSSGGAGLSLFCYDIAGAVAPVSTSSGSGFGSGSVSVAPFSITPNSFVVAQYVNSGPATASFTAGSGFTLTPGTPIASTSSASHGNTVGAEYGVTSSSSTNCPITNSFEGNAAQGWGGVCYAFAPASP